MTDHSIPRKPRRRKPSYDPRERPAALPDNPLLPFHRGGPGAERDADRDWALALFEAARKKGKPFQRYLPRALRLLEQVLNEHPDDVAVLECLGVGLELKGQKAEALETFKAILRLAPRHIQTLRRAARLTMHFQQDDTSLEYWERLATVIPLDPEPHFCRALLLTRTRQYGPALEACGKLLEVDPMSAEAHVVRAHCLMKLGKKGEAEAAEKNAEELKTPTLEAFREAFTRFTE
jgi:tetratricopeptide (TPR) repeat protein